ncbi:MAG: hypothetical protein AAF985_25205 [Bacteroidota bacterium]
MISNLKKPDLSKEKLFVLLRSLTVKQLGRWQKLLHSPYFHQTQELQALFAYMKPFHPQYPTDVMSHEQLAQHFYADKKGSIKKIKNYKADMVQLLEEWLIQEQLKQDPTQRQYYLAKAYQDLPLPKYAQSTFQKAQKKAEAQVYRDLPFFLHQMQMTHLQYFHPDTGKFLQNQELLNNLMDHLDQFYFLAKYKYALDMLEREEKFEEQYYITLWEEVQCFQKQQAKAKQWPLLILYQRLIELKAKKTIDASLFHQLQTLFFNQISLLRPEDQQAIFKYLINYTIKAINSGEARFIPIQFALYQKGIPHHLLVLNQRITVITFYNVVSIAARLAEFDWIEQFIEEYQSFLPPTDRSDTIAICKAFVAFNQGFYEATLRLLLPVQLKNSALHLICIPLQVKSLFMIYLQDHSYDSTIYSKLNSLTRRLQKRYSLSEQNKVGYKKYIDQLRRLLRAHQSPRTSIQKIEQIRDSIEQSQQIIHQKWLIDVANQLIALKGAPQK